MGGGSYDSGSAMRSAQSYSTKRAEQIFNKGIHNLMVPKGITLRESRDSDEHPNSVPIIIALDETGSMGRIPEELIKGGLVHIMDHVIAHGVLDPQILFLGIGDHISDNAPLQVAQFESNDKDLNMWLERVYLESNGGGNGGESYSLAHYFANNFVQTDAWDKRQQKGFLFTIGDENYHENIPASFTKQLMGLTEASSIISKDEIKKAQDKWHVYHIIPGRGEQDQWKNTLGEACIVCDSNKIAETISNIITKYQNNLNNTKSEEMKKNSGKGTPAAPKEQEGTGTAPSTDTDAKQKPSVFL
jgi:hypothetical protein